MDVNGTFRRKDCRVSAFTLVTVDNTQQQEEKQLHYAEELKEKQRKTEEERQRSGEQTGGLWLPAAPPWRGGL